MSRIRIDPAAIQSAETALATAEAAEVEARAILTEIELRRDTIRWAQQQAAHEYHSSTSASWLYMTAYGSSRRHLNQCNANMDRKQAIDRKYQENLDDVVGPDKSMTMLSKKSDRLVKNFAVLRGVFKTYLERVPFCNKRITNMK